MMPTRWISIAVVMVPFLAGCGSQASVAELPSLQLDGDRIAVVGVSSGAAMAQQVHFAFSDHVIGAGLIAGTPLGCAEGDLNTALGRCMKAQPDAPDTVLLAERAQALADDGKLAPLSGLEGDRVWVFHGTADAVVAETVSKASYSIYEALAQEVATPPVKGMQLTWDGSREIGHSWPTLSSGTACAATEAPFISNCNFDAAGEMLKAIYGEPRHAVADASGTTHSINQDEYRLDGADAFLAKEGFLYVPKACAERASCGVVVAFHGCEQNAETLGRAFIDQNGLNRWADAHELVVVYPQTRASFMPLNPKACWDWWGYSGEGYATREGRQLQWLANLMKHLGAPLTH